MPRRRQTPGTQDVGDYRHEQSRRRNNPPAGLAPTYEVRERQTTPYAYDPHLDPQLVWAGKAEHTSFDVDVVSLHIHERISTRAILDAVRRPEPIQGSLFGETPLPADQQVEFYQHDVNWANRLILGDSLLVMNSLLVKEGMAGKVQMIYVDPPYGISYSSNFQAQTDGRNVKDRDEDLTHEPEQIKAYRDTWRLGVHSYLTYLRDRLLLARDLLSETGSIFVQIGDENVHRVGLLMDEVFRPENRIATISFATTSGSSTGHLPQVADYLLWYAKDKSNAKYRQLYEPLSRKEMIEYFSSYAMVELPDGTARKPTDLERYDPDAYVPDGSKVYRRVGLDSQGVSTTGRSEPYSWNGVTYACSPNRHWSVSPAGMDRLSELGRLDAASESGTLMWKRYEDEVPGRRINNVWPDQMYATDKRYVVETAAKPIQRCILMTTDPGDLVFDPTCGSGNTAYVAEQWGRRWITCDTSRVALSLARQRLVTATFDYYQLAHPEEGIDKGLVYKVVEKVTAGTLAYDESPIPVSIYDQPRVVRGVARVSGPFTVEAIPLPAVEDPSAAPIPQFEDAPVVGPVDDRGGTYVADMVRLLGQQGGVLFPGGKTLPLQNLRPLNVGWLHAEGETQQNGDTSRVAVSFGPQHGPLTAFQVQEAVPTARMNGYAILIFAGFAFDPEAQALIQRSPVAGLQVHFVHISPDVLVGDLLKTNRASQIFSVFGQPDVAVTRQKGKNTYTVELRGVDIYDPLTGETEHAGGGEVAAWFLDSDHDGMTFHICQAFFPGDGRAWQRLQRALKARIDAAAFHKMRGTVSFPFEVGQHQRIAVKVVDFRGNEVVRVARLNLHNARQ